MFSPKLYIVRKFPLSFIISNKYNLDLSKDQEEMYYIKQSDNMLFRQIRLISNDSSEFNKYVVFVDCTGGQSKPEEIKKLIVDGFFVCGKHYLVSERSASMVRTSILSFVRSDVYKELDNRITMEISFDKTVLSKYYAYRGLMFSGCHCIENWFPKMIVVPDMYSKIQNQKIKYVYDKKSKFIDRNTGEEREWTQKDITEGIRDIEINVFDGCGICHPSIMRKFEEKIHTDCRVNSLIMRAPYIKGVIHEMDYVEFFKERGIKKIKDIWGEEYGVEETDDPLIILCESMYKGYKYFKKDGSIEDWNRYWGLFKKYNHCIGVTKWNFSIDQEPLMTRANYQILQDLDLPFDEFKDLANDSIEWYEKIISGDPIYTYCFLGMLAESHSPMNNYAAAILRNPDMLHEQSTKEYVRGLLKKYKDEFKCGKLWLNATFKFLAPDMIALMEHIGGLEVSGCLSSDEFFGFDRRGIMIGERLIDRNPHICRSEHTILKGVTNPLTDKYCSHLTNVCMINCKSLTPQRLNGADFDGDLVLLISDQRLLKGVDRDCPIVLDVEDKVCSLAEPDDVEHKIACTIRGLKSMIGEISNYATAYHNRCASSEKTKKEYESYIDLLSVCNGKAIDFSKTGVLFPVPRNIATYGRPLPYFMKYVSQYYSSLKNLSKAYSNMNKLCMSLERWERGAKYKKDMTDFDWTIMYDEDIGYNEEVFVKVEEIFLDFIKKRKELVLFEKKCKNWALYHKEIEDKISKKEAKLYETNWQAVYNIYRNKCQLVCPDVRELANILVVLCYHKYPNKYKKFMWHMAGAGIVENIKPVECSLPTKDPNGEYLYLGQRYSLAEKMKYDAYMGKDSVY